MSKIVVLDGHTMNPGDLSWEPIKQLGEVKIFPRTAYKDVVDRVGNAQIIVINKTPIDNKILSQLPDLQCICVSATGFNTVDTTAARAQNIPVCNAVGYSTPSVAQHVFALILELVNNVGRHNESVQNGDWAKSADWSYFLSPIRELAGKTMGIYGFGRIGQQVATIAQAFDMKILSTHKHPQRDARPDVRFVDLETLFKESDFISLHAPLSDENQGVVNHDLINQMKPDSFLINTGRGGLINEQDLRQALENERIAGAGLDVLSEEPPPADHPLIGLKNCIITPHQAWATRESRSRLMEIVADNIKAFLEGNPQNVVN